MDLQKENVILVFGVTHPLPTFHVERTAQDGREALAHLVTWWPGRGFTGRFMIQQGQTTLWIQVADLNALFWCNLGPICIFLGGTWIHRARTLGHITFLGLRRTPSKSALEKGVFLPCQG